MNAYLDSEKNSEISTFRKVCVFQYFKILMNIIDVRYFISNIYNIH